MNILELVKAKTAAKDLIEHRGQYFEAKSIKNYLKLCKKVKDLQVNFNPIDNQLVFEHTHGLAKFNFVSLIEYSSTDEIKWIGHDGKVKTGKAWSVEL